MLQKSKQNVISGSLDCELDLPQRDAFSARTERSSMSDQIEDLSALQANAKEPTSRDDKSPEASMPYDGYK